MRGNRVERIYREVRVNAIGGGSEEIMRDLATRQFGFDNYQESLCVECIVRPVKECKEQSPKEYPDTKTAGHSLVKKRLGQDRA